MNIHQLQRIVPKRNSQVTKLLIVVSTQRLVACCVTVAVCGKDSFVIQGYQTCRLDQLSYNFALSTCTSPHISMAKYIPLHSLSLYLTNSSGETSRLLSDIPTCVQVAIGLIY